MSCVREAAQQSCPAARIRRLFQVPVLSPDLSNELQVDQLDLLADYVDAGNYSRTCLYLTSTSAYLPEPDDQLVLVKARL